MPVVTRVHSHSLLSLCLCAPLVACGGSGEARTTKGRPGRGGPTTTPVAIALAEYGRVTRTSTVAGIIEAIRVVGVNAQLTGAHGSVRVLEGARVAEWDTLATVFALELDAQLESSRAALDFARSTAGRSEAQFKQRIITAAEVERDRTALAAAQSIRAALVARLEHATIRASMPGIVTERQVESGDIVSPNQRLFTIADVSTLVTRVQVSELEVGALRSGQELR
jgi:multidrug efflux pump subunit AcrA (membrane-fusion protein)